MNVYQAAGYHAYATRQGLTACPYRWSTHPEAVRAWNAGWAAARTDHKTMNRRQTAPLGRN